MKSIVRTAQSINELSEFWNSVPENTLVLLDVDDTLIRPQSVMFDYHSGHQQFIDDLKKRHHEIDNFAEILGQWLIKRQVMLVEDAWPQLIKNLKSKPLTRVYGFTQINTGVMPYIKSMEEWRADELQSMDIIFSHDDQPSVKLCENNQGYACFHRGVLITGPFSKCQLLDAFLQQSSDKPSHIIFVDDRLDHIEAIKDYAAAKDIGYTGIHYQGAQILQRACDPQVMAYQQRMLMEQTIWLEDEEAHNKFYSLTA